MVNNLYIVAYVPYFFKIGISAIWLIDSIIDRCHLETHQNVILIALTERTRNRQLLTTGREFDLPCGSTRSTLIMCVLRMYIDNFYCLPTPSKDTKPIASKLPEKASKVKWRDKIPDTEVLACASMLSLHTYKIQAKMDWLYDKNAFTRLSKKLCLESWNLENEPMMVRWSASKDTLKPSLKDSESNKVKKAET